MITGSFQRPELPKIFEDKDKCLNAWCGYGAAGRFLFTKNEAAKWQIKGMQVVQCRTKGAGWHIVNPELNEWAFPGR